MSVELAGSTAEYSASAVVAAAVASEIVVPSQSNQKERKIGYLYFIQKIHHLSEDL